MKQIFYEDRKIVFISQKKLIEPADNQKIWIYTDLLELLKEFKHFLKSPQGFTLYVSCANQSTALFQNFIQCFEILKAGGGLVRNSDNKFLYIYRYDQWDLPKGKKEKGEKITQAALREVEEETTIQPLTITKALPNTYHFILRKTNVLVKKCYWYEMTTESTILPSPQIQENITHAVWLSEDEIMEKRPQMYASIAHLTDIYFGGQIK